MAKKLKNILQYLFFLGLGFFLIWWSLDGLTEQDTEQISDAISRGNYIWVIPGLTLILLSHWVRALRWRMLIEPLGYSPSKLNTFFAVMVGYLANLAVPRLGEVLRCSALTKYEKIPLDKLAGTVILERIIDTICLLIVFALALALQPNLYQNIIETFFGKPNAQGSNNLFLYLIISVVILLCGIGMFVLFCSKKNNGLAVQLKKIALHVWQGLISIKSLKKPGLFIFQSLAIWAMYTVSVIIGFMLLQETQQYGITEALTVLSAGTLAMAATPGGIGAYAFLVQKTMFLYHLNGGIGLALGWMLWILQVCIVLIVGGLSLIGLPFLNRKESKTAINQLS